MNILMECSATKHTHRNSPSCTILSPCLQCSPAQQCNCWVVPVGLQYLAFESRRKYDLVSRPRTKQAMDLSPGELQKVLLEKIIMAVEPVKMQGLVRWPWADTSRHKRNWITDLSTQGGRFSLPKPIISSLQFWLSNEQTQSVRYST